MALLVVGGPMPSQADTTAQEVAADTLRGMTIVGVPVVFSDDTLFFVYSPLGEFIAPDRATHIVTMLRILAHNEQNLDSIRLYDTEGVTDALLDTSRVFSVTTADAKALGVPRRDLADRYRTIVINAVSQRRGQLSLKDLLTKVGLVVLFAALLFAAFWVMRRIFPLIYAALERWEGKVFRSIRVRSHEILKASTLTTFLILVAKGVRLLLSLILLYFFLIYLLSVIPWTSSWDPGPLLRGLLYAVIITAVAGALARAGGKFFSNLTSRIESWRGKLIKPVRIKTIEVLSEDRIVELLRGSIRIVRFGALVMLAYLYVTLVFSLFDFSQTWAASLFGYIINPLRSVLISIVRFLPNLFFIIVIIFVTRAVIKLIRLIFIEVGRGKITFPRFYSEWAEPTYRIVRFLVIAFAGIMIFPYLPGSDSPAFQGVSIFLGVLFSLGSTSAIANIIAGLVITYMRPFTIGDRVRIAETEGDIIEKNLLVTRIRTVKNVDITVPNAMVLGSHITNFSSSAQDRGLILHTGVTIGYDVPWRKVHELLREAALRTANVSKEPAPFVLQKSLDDFYVSYELNAVTDQPNMMAKIYSDLHQNIQDTFNEAGVEIMSPHYGAMRDGNQRAIPNEYLPPTYEAPSFRLHSLSDLLGQPRSKPREPDPNT
jgi:small-conductance mechanosensitive channel